MLASLRYWSSRHPWYSRRNLFPASTQRLFTLYAESKYKWAFSKSCCCWAIRAKETREYSAQYPVFPELLKLSVGTDYQAFSLLRQKNAQKKFLFKSDLLKDALMGWDESAAFQKAPCELQCVCIAVSGIGSDAWSSFESEKILAAEKMNAGIFEELFDD